MYIVSQTVRHDNKLEMESVFSLLYIYLQNLAYAWHIVSKQ